MSKDNSSKNPETALTHTLGVKAVALPSTNLPKGYQHLTPIMIKWDDENIGKILSGTYQGYTENTSRFNPVMTYRNHRLRLFNGFVVCFNGSKMLDDVLSDVCVDTIIHIIYKGRRKLENGQSFKEFQILTQSKDDTDFNETTVTETE